MTALDAVLAALLAVLPVLAGAGAIAAIVRFELEQRRLRTSRADCRPGRTARRPFPSGAQP